MNHPTTSELVAGYRRYQKRKRLSQSAIRHGRYRTVALARFLHPKHLLDATEDDLNDFIDTWEVADATHATYIAQMRSFYRWAKKQGYIPFNPSSDLERPSVPRRVPRPIDDDSLEEAWDDSRLDADDARMVLILALMAFAGLRCMEVAGLRFEGIHIFRVPAEDGSVGTITVVGKGGKERTIPLHPEVLFALEKYWEWRHEQNPVFSGGPHLPRRGNVFCRQHGLGKAKTGYYEKALGAGYVSALVSEVLPEQYTAHQLRHWFGTWMYRSCKDLILVGQAMGHARLDTTRGYADADTSRTGAVVVGLAIGQGQARRGRLRSVG